MSAPDGPLRVLAAEPEGWCDPETGLCALPDRRDEASHERPALRED